MFLIVLGYFGVFGPFKIVKKIFGRNLHFGEIQMISRKKTSFLNKPVQKM